MVTVTGIFLGFLFNATASWASRTPTGSRIDDAITTVGLCSCIVLLIIVLSRILNISYPRDKAVPYFKKTLRLFITGLTIAFIVFVLTKVQNAFVLITGQ
jgi:hypothetical protein